MKTIKDRIIIANWKMNPVSAKEAEKLFLNIKKLSSGIKNIKIIICPPYLYLGKLNSLNRQKNISLGAQNGFFGEKGAFTGEVSMNMLYSLGARFVILGHSERRSLGEDNNIINKKLKSALEAGLMPVLCIGESSRDENHEYFNFIKKQIEECLNGISKNLVTDIIIAYEPVWSISTTLKHHNATAEDIKETVVYIRKTISNMYSFKTAQDVKIIYGGSVNKKNILDFMKNGGVRGALVGSASLEAKEFIEIMSLMEHENN